MCRRQAGRRVWDPAATQMRKGLWGEFLVSSMAVSSSQRMAQAAPTLMRQQSSALRGKATTGEFSTSSTVIFIGPWAKGLNRAYPRCLTAISARVCRKESSSLPKTCQYF